MPNFKNYFCKTKLTLSKITEWIFFIFWKENKASKAIWDTNEGRKQRENFWVINEQEFGNCPKTDLGGGSQKLKIVGKVFSRVRIRGNRVAEWDLRRMMACEKFPVMRMASVAFYFIPCFLCFLGSSYFIHTGKHGWESAVKHGNCNRIENLKQNLTLTNSCLWKYWGRFWTFLPSPGHNHPGHPNHIVSNITYLLSTGHIPGIFMHHATYSCKVDILSLDYRWGIEALKDDMSKIDQSVRNRAEIWAQIYLIPKPFSGFPGSARVKVPTCQCRRH